MRRHVAELARAVAAKRKDLPVANERRTDRDFPAFARGGRRGKRALHEVLPAAGHLASLSSRC
jgi:hypothetical protein